MSAIDDPRVVKRADDHYEVDGVWIIRYIDETREWRLTHLFSVAPKPFEMFDDLADAIDTALQSQAPFGLVA